jgi:tetratricopeptide (TPR) repeat protein
LTIGLFRTITGFNEINKKLESISRQTENLVTLVKENHLNTKETISGFSLHINEKITELSKDAEEQIRNIDTTLLRICSSNFKEIEKVKSLITFYTEEVKNKKAAEHLLFVNTLVESDNSTQQLLGEGFLKYQEEDFTASIKIYKKILAIDFSNKEALCFFNASLYYQNPGDRTIFPGIKKDLIPLLKEKTLTKDEAATALNVLIGISREEGNADSLKQYQGALQQLEAGRK